LLNSEKPIGVFDSGIGGLTVVKKLQASLPNERIIYFGDTARVPYGAKSNDIITEYAIQDADFLINKNVKMIIVACNTVSSVALNILRARYSVPVIGTYSTIRNKAYSKMLTAKNPDVEVYEKACPLFVPLAEEGWTDHKATYLIAREYLSELCEKNIDTLILGCTHYPILSDVIQEVVGEDVKLIDSGTAAAATIEKHPELEELLSKKIIEGNHEYYVSDLPVKFKTIAERFLGRTIENVEKIDPEHL